MTLRGDFHSLRRLGIQVLLSETESVAKCACCQKRFCSALLRCNPSTPRCRVLCIHAASAFASSEIQGPALQHNASSFAAAAAAGALPDAVLLGTFRCGSLQFIGTFTPMHQKWPLVVQPIVRCCRLTVLFTQQHQGLMQPSGWKHMKQEHVQQIMVYITRVAHEQALHLIWEIQNEVSD